MPLVERDQHRADRVREVPEHQRARLVRDPGQAGPVGEEGRAVRDVAEHHERRPLPHRRLEQVGGDAGAGVDVDPPQRQPALLGDAVGHVAVGREVVAVEDDLGAVGAQRDGGPHQLVEQHRGGVADHDLTRGGAERHPAELVAEGLGQVEPPLVPPADQPSAPLLGHEPAQPVGRHRQRAPERVAVEVHERGVRADEAVAVGRQRVGGVEAGRPVRRGAGRGGSHEHCLPDGTYVRAVEIRTLTDDDREQSWRLSVESFGGPPPGSPLPAPPARRTLEGRHTWGAFEDDGRLARQGGRLRLRLVVRRRRRADLRHRERGGHGGGAGPRAAQAAVRDSHSRTTSDAASRSRRCSPPPTASTARSATSWCRRSTPCRCRRPSSPPRRPWAPPPGVPPRATCRPIQEVYTAWASAQNGPLTRTGARFDADDLLGDVTAVTLAVAGDRVTGFLSWQRGDSYQPDAVLTVEDLVAVDADAYRALWQVLATFASVTGTVRLTTSGDDPARHVLRTATWDVVARHPYMVRLLDLAGRDDRAGRRASARARHRRAHRHRRPARPARRLLRARGRRRRRDLRAHRPPGPARGRRRPSPPAASGCCGPAPSRAATCATSATSPAPTTTTTCSTRSSAAGSCTSGTTSKRLAQSTGSPVIAHLTEDLRM